MNWIGKRVDGEAGAPRLWRPLSRRQFLSALATTGAVLSAGGLLSACTPAAPASPAPTTAPQSGATAPTSPPVAAAAAPTTAPTTAPAVAKQAVTLVVGIPEAITNPDPVILGQAGYGDAKAITDNINEGLLRYKPGTVEVEPALAESWDVSSDGLTYTFHIRPNVKFHDGTPVNAEAVKLNYDRQTDEKNPYHFQGITYTEIVFGDVDRVEVSGERDLKITMKRPTVQLLGNLAMYVEGMVSPAALQKYGNDYSQHPIGTGPFKFDHWTKDVEFAMVANDDYWGGRPKVDKVVFRTIKDNTVRLQELRAASIDVTTELDLKDVDSVKSSADLQTINGSFLDTQYIGMNTVLAPFDNVKVRQAVQYAINKQNIAKALFYGNYTLGAGPIHPSLPGYDGSLQSVYTYDPAKAKQLLADAGLSSGFQLELLTRSEGIWPLEVQLVQADLAAIGANVTVKQMDSAAFYDQINASKGQIFLNDWVYDTGDPDNIMFSVFSSPRARSRLGYNSPEEDKLNLAAQTERDANKRIDLYKQAQKILLQDSPMVFLGYPARIMGAKKGIANLKVSPIGSLPLGGVTVG